MPAASPRRRWFRISLRTMLLLVTLLCIWLGVKVNQARRQKEAIAALNSIGVIIGFHHDVDNEGHIKSAAEPPGPAWLRQFTGDDFFQRVWSVTAGNTGFTDEYAEHLSAFDDVVTMGIYEASASDEALARIGDVRALESLRFTNTPVGDRFMRRLAQAHQLQHLMLEGTQVTGDGLSKLSNLRKVKSITLTNSPIGNEGLRGLSSMTNLVGIVFADLPIDDNGIEYLPDMSKVTELELCRVGITDTGLKKLKTGPALKHLHLSGTKVRGDALPTFCGPHLISLHLGDTLIDDDVLLYLEKATGLIQLFLEGTEISDDGLSHLAKVPSLMIVDLRRTEVTGPGLRHLVKLPKLYELFLGNTKLSREGFELLQTLPAAPPGAGFLDLEGTPLDDSTMQFLDGLSVAQLFLSKTKITDAGLAKLTNMPNLQNIDLTDTAVTPAGVVGLKQRIPLLVTVQTSFDPDSK